MAQAIRDVLEKKKKENSSAFVAFVTSGFPNLQDTVSIMLALEEGGADIIELGIAHSDPIADGPTIQEASQVALANGITMEKTLEYIAEARMKGLKAPVVLMGYTNTFYAFGYEKICGRVKEVGGNGFIVVDLPPEESKEFRSHCTKYGLSFIPLIAPVTSVKRMQFLNTIADSFIYCVSLLGVTGIRDKLPDDLPLFIESVRKHVNKPLCIGFGISNRQLFAEASRLGEGVVVGSGIIKALTQGSNPVQIARDFAKSLTTPLPNEKPFEKVAFKNQENQLVVKEEENRIPAFFGEFGGRFAPETLHGALDELETAYAKLRNDPDFQKELKSFYDYVGRPTPLYKCTRLSDDLGGATIWLKREDLCHTGAHKINNAIGQALIAKRLGKTRIIAETGAGQHGVATATICAKLGLECVVYMGSEDIQRQSLNVFRMKMLGAKVISAESGSKTLKDAINEAMRDWVTYIKTTHYLVGSAIGPHPFPTIVRDFQSVIGKEARSQFLEKVGRLPDAVVACVGGGSNSIGMFHPFIEDKSVRIIGVEAAGSGVDSGKHCATLMKGTPGVLHGTRTFILQDAEGQITETHSVSAGLDYPGVGPEHAFLKASGRAEYVAVDDKEALEGFKLLAAKEGILPALETSHAIYFAAQEAKRMKRDQHIVICLSGRGDKDMGTIAKELGVTLKM